MLLFIDLETIGLPSNYESPYTDLKNWPPIIEIAWILTDNKGQEIENNTYLLDSEGKKIPGNIAKLYNLSENNQIIESSNKIEIFKKLAEIINQSDALISHNVSFIKKVIQAEFKRKKIDSNIHKINTICTMNLSTFYCKLPGKYGYKYPKLRELYKCVFSVNLLNHRYSKVKVEACKNSFFELINRGIFKYYDKKAVNLDLLNSADDDLIYLGNIDDQIDFNGNFQFYAKIGHKGLDESKTLKASNEFTLMDKTEDQIFRYQIKWNKIKDNILEEIHHFSQKNKAQEKTTEATNKLNILRNILKTTLEKSNEIPWDSFKKNLIFDELSPDKKLPELIANLKNPTKPEAIKLPKKPQKSDKLYQPSLNWIEKKILRSLKRKKISENDKKFDSDYTQWLKDHEDIIQKNNLNLSIYNNLVTDYQNKKTRIIEQNKIEVKSWEERKKFFIKQQDQYNQNIDNLKNEYLSGEINSINLLLNLILENSHFPDFLQKKFNVVYNPLEKMVIVNFPLPTKASLPAIKKYKYVASENSVFKVKFSEREQNKLFEDVIFQISIKTIYEIFSLDLINKISAVQFNGYIEEQEKSFIISINCSKALFSEILFNNTDFKTLIKKLNGKYKKNFSEIKI